MKIVLERSGGFAAVPGLSRDIIIDAAELPAELASQLQQLVAALQLEQPPKRPTRTGAADIGTYRLAINDEGRTHVLEFTDLALDPSLDALVTWLEGISRRQ